MNPHDVLAAWSAWWWPLVAAHLWQSTLFLAATWLAVLLLRNASAGTRYRAWLIASVKFALPALLLGAPLGWLGIGLATSVPYLNTQSFIDQWTFGQQALESTQLTAVSGEAALHHELYCLLTLTWLAGLTLLAIRWVSHSRRLVRLIAESREPDDPVVAGVLDQARKAVGVKRPIQLRASSAIDTPAAYGILRPVVLIPIGISVAVNEAELQAVLMHELVHIRRFDNLTAAFQRLLCCFFWFHPLVWLLDRKLLSERELCCDQAVIKHTGAPRAYAAGILKICRLSFGASPAGVSLASGSSLGRRIRMITGPSPQRTRSSHRLVLAGLTCALVLLCLVVAPPRSSQAAQAGAVKIGTCAQCPVTLLEADVSSGAESSPTTLRVRNDGDRPVKYFYMVLENPTTEQKAYFRVAEPVQPGETKSITIQPKRAAVAIKQGENRFRIETVAAEEARRRVGDLSQAEAKVPTVVFDDDTSFTLKGYLPAPPPPPPPPAAPPAPPPPPVAGDRGAAPPPPAIPAPPAPPPPPPGLDDDEHFIGGVVGGVPGGVKGGVVGGVVGGVPGGVKGGVVGGVPGGVNGGVKNQTPKPAPAPKPAPQQ